MHGPAPKELPEWLRRAPLCADDPLGAARALRPIIEQHAAESEAAGTLAEPIVRAIAESGLLGLFVPKELGGIEADPDTFIDVIEELSYADGSTGWVMMATAFGTSGAALWLGDEAIKTMYVDGGGYVCAGQSPPVGKAVREEGGWRVQGTGYQFGSGAAISSYIFGTFVIYEDGKPVTREDGSPKVIAAFAPRSRVDLKEESWDVMGLKATRSVDFEFPEQFVPDEFVMWPISRDRRGGPTYDIPVTIAHVSWALGVGMRALHEIRDIARRKRRPGRPTLIDQPTFQRDFAEFSGSMEAARTYVRSAFRDWYKHAQAGTVDNDIRVHGRLSGCWATKIAAGVGRFAYLAGGSDGLRNGPENRLQRCFRDLHAGAIHKHIDDNVLIECGRVLLGVDDGTAFRDAVLRP